MEVARVVRRSQLREIERDHARGVRAVDEGVHPSSVELAHEAFDGEKDSGRARNVIEQREACLRRNAGEDGIDDLFGVFEWKREASDGDLGSAALRVKVEGVPARIVRLVGGQERIARSEFERSQDGIHSGCRVGHERYSRFIGPKERSERLARRIEERLELTHEEADGLALDLIADAPLRLKHDAKTRTERSVIQKGDRRIKAERARKLTRHGIEANLVHRRGAPCGRSRCVHQAKLT
jgi:hypothetical protein